MWWSEGSGRSTFQRLSTSFHRFSRSFKQKHFCKAEISVYLMYRRISSIIVGVSFLLPLCISRFVFVSLSHSPIFSIFLSLVLFGFKSQINGKWKMKNLKALKTLWRSPACCWIFPHGPKLKRPNNNSMCLVCIVCWA